MSIFKKKIDFSQFLSEVVTFQFGFLEQNFHKLIVLADELKALTEKDREEFVDKAHELIIVDILMNCTQHFYKNLSSEEVGEAVGIVYGGYLIDYKKVPKPVVEKKLEKAMELFELVCKAEEDIQKRDEHYRKIGYKSYPKIDNEINKQKFYLCRAFAEYCAGEDMKAPNWEGKHFAAFKLAKAIVKADLVKIMLREFKIKWK